MKRKEAIKQIQEGKIQICNDLLPSTKEIKKFLKEAFPDDKYLKNNTPGYFLNKNTFFVAHPDKSDDFKGKWFSFIIKQDLPIINLSTITKRKKTKLRQLEKQFSDLAKDVSELRQTLAKDVEVDVEEVKSELVVGEWYKRDNFGKIMFCFSGKFGNSYETNSNYGFDFNGIYKDKLGVQKDVKYIKATPQEVQTALENEAKKRGFKEGVVIKNHQGTFTLSKLDIVYSQKYNNGIYTRQGGGVWLMINGVWSEIIQQERNKEEEINFSVQELFIHERGTYIVCSNGKQNLDENTFEGKVIYSTGVHQDINIFSKNWSKNCFKTFKGELTIK